MSASSGTAKKSFSNDAVKVTGHSTSEVTSSSKSSYLCQEIILGIAEFKPTLRLNNYQDQATHSQCKFKCHDSSPVQMWLIIDMGFIGIRIGFEQSTFLKKYPKRWFAM